jgi:hypothetical protein
MPRDLHSSPESWETSATLVCERRAAGLQRSPPFTARAPTGTSPVLALPCPAGRRRSTAAPGGGRPTRRAHRVARGAAAHTHPRPRRCSSAHAPIQRTWQHQNTRSQTLPYDSPCPAHPDRGRRSHHRLHEARHRPDHRPHPDQSGRQHHDQVRIQRRRLHRRSHRSRKRWR